MAENSDRVRKARLINLAPASDLGPARDSVRLEVTASEQLEFMADHLDEMSVIAFGSGLDTLGGLLRLARDEARTRGGIAPMSGRVGKSSSKGLPSR
jgi:hypothetical protein